MKPLRLMLLLVGVGACASGPNNGATDSSVSTDAALDTTVADAGPPDVSFDIGIDAGCTDPVQCDDGNACSLNECTMGACVTTMPYDTSSDPAHCGDECMACPEPSEFQANMVPTCRASTCGLECIEGATTFPMSTVAIRTVTVSTVPSASASSSPPRLSDDVMGPAHKTHPSTPSPQESPKQRPVKDDVRSTSLKANTTKQLCCVKAWGSSAATTLRPGSASQVC